MSRKLKPVARRAAPEPQRVTRRKRVAAAPYHHGNLREALLTAGIELLRNEGAEALGLRELARQAGVSRTAPYRHFANRDALIAAIAEQGFVKLKQALLEARAQHETDHEAWFLEAGRQYIRFALTHAEHFKVMFGERMKYEPDAHPNVHEAGNGAFQTLVDLIVASQNSGLVIQGDPIQVSITVWSFVHGFPSLVVQRRLEFLLQDSEALAAIAEQVVRATLEGVRARRHSRKR